MRPGIHRIVAGAAAVAVGSVLGASAGCAQEAPEDVAALFAFTGAVLVDGTGADPVHDAVLVSDNGRITAVGPASAVEVPEGAQRVELDGAWIVPGLVNAHGHVGTADGLDSGPGAHTRANVLSQLRLYARYGVTTVVSLGDPGTHTLALRDARQDPGLTRARLHSSGPVITPSSPEQAVRDVAGLADRGAEWVKFRVDDFLGMAEKMSPEVYTSIIDEARRRDLPVAVHIVDLEDAKGVLEAGAHLIAHSVRDAPVDDELIGLMLERDICLTPTLTRELSVFVYADRPDFFDDPFFLQHADEDVLEALQEPDRQAQVRESRAAQYFEAALPLAKENMMTLHEAGVRIAMGTDSGPPARFQGYFEHVELEMMQSAGMSPAEVLYASTGQAAACMGLDDVGTLEVGRWADFLVLDEDPLEDVRGLRALREVRIAGNRVE